MKKLTGVLIATVFGLALFACSSKSSQEHIEAAEQLAEEGKYNAAIIELKNAVTKDVDSGRARLLLGELYFEQGDMASAEKELGRAYELGVEEGRVFPLYAQSLLALGKHESLLALDAGSLEPNGRSTVLAAQALAYLSTGRTEEGEQAIAAAEDLENPSAFTQVAAARFSLAYGDVETAREQIQRALAIDSDYAEAWSLLGDVAVREGDYEAAVNHYSSAIEAAHNNFALHYKRALVLLSNQQGEEADKDLAALGRIAAEHPGLSFLMGMKHFQQGDFGNAKGPFQKATIAAESYPLAFYYLASLNQREGNLNTAINNINRFMSLAPQNIAGMKLAAVLEAQNDNSERAEELLRSALFTDPGDTEVMNLLANLLLSTGKNEEAVSLLEKVKQLDPGSPEALTRLGAGYMLTGNQVSAIENLEAALNLKPDYERAEVALILSFIQEGNTEKAVETARQNIEDNPDKASPYNLLARVYIASGDSEKAEVQFQKALGLEPGNPEAGLGLANLAFQQRRFSDAKTLLQSVLDKHPDHLATLVNIAAVHAIEGNEDEMVASLSQATEKHPKALQPRLVLSRYYLVKGEPGKAANVLGELAPARKSLPEVKAVLAVSEIEQQKYAPAKSKLKELVDAQPGNPINYFQFARASAGLGEVEPAIQHLNKALELAPDFFQARLALARLYLLTNAVAPFEKELDKLREVAPDQPDVVQLRAALANIKGDRKLATELLEKIHADRPSTSSVIALATNYQRAGDVDKAIETLEGWVDSQATDLFARAALAETYIKAEQLADAREQYEEILELDPDNTSSLNNLAWILRDENPERALTHINRAVELAPESPNLWDTKAVIHMKAGNPGKAREAIDEAVRLNPQNPVIRFHSAELYFQQGSYGQATQILEELVKLEGFADRDKAVKLLEKIRTRPARASN